MQLIQVGKVGKPHGYSGAFVTLLDSGRDSALAFAQIVYVGPAPDKTEPHAVEEAAWMPKGWKLKLAGIASDEEVKRRGGQFLYVDRAVLPSAGTDEYYAGDLQGMTVREAETDKVVGTFSTVETPGDDEPGPDRWWIDSPNGAFAVPATKRFIARVDVAGRTLWLRNLRDLL